MPDLINRLIEEGHELASHTYYHSDFENEHLKCSKEALEQQFGVTVEGLRMPRMLEVSAEEVKKQVIDIIHQLILLFYLVDIINYTCRNVFLMKMVCGRYPQR